MKRMSIHTNCCYCEKKIAEAYVDEYSADNNGIGNAFCFHCSREQTEVHGFT